MFGGITMCHKTMLQLTIYHPHNNCLLGYFVQEKNSHLAACTVMPWCLQGLEFPRDTVLTYVPIIKENKSACTQSLGLFPTGHATNLTEDPSKEVCMQKGTRFFFYIMNFEFYDFLINIHWGFKISVAQTDRSWFTKF